MKSVKLISWAKILPASKKVRKVTRAVFKNLESHLRNLNKISTIRNEFPWYKYLYYKYKRTAGFILVILLILFSYYMFVFWHLLPNIENTYLEVHSLRMFDSNSLIETSQHSAFLQLIIFHILFFMSMICLSLTVLKNPGYISNDYVR